MRSGKDWVEVGGVCISTIGDIQHRGLCERAPLCSVARGKIVTGT